MLNGYPCGCVGYKGNVTPLCVCVGAAGGSFVVMATSQTCAPMGLKTPTDLTQSAFRVNFPSLFNELFKSVCVCMYIQACAHNVSVTCHWQVESTYVTIVVGGVKQCVCMQCGFLQC